MYCWKNVHHLHEYVLNRRVCLLLLILLDIYTEVMHNSLNTSFNLLEHLIRTVNACLSQEMNTEFL
jgi:hypothetical protein